MNRMKKMLSGLLVVIMMFTAILSIPNMTVLAADTYNFEIVTEVYPHGQEVKAVIIDAGKAVKASSIDVNTFAVSTTNLHPTTGAAVYEGERKVTNAYVSDFKSVDGTGSETGRYIVLELEVGFGVTGSSTLVYTGYNLVLTLNYKVEQLKAFENTDGTVNVGDASYNKAGEIDEILDKFSYGTSESSGYDYRLYSPERPETEKLESVPLVVWLHGGGERVTAGNENEAQLRANMGGAAWALPENQAKNPCYVLAPQSTGWTGSNVVSLIKEIVAAYPDIDTSRIYIAGCSMGGAGTWNTILTEPGLFAAAITCPGGNTGDAQTLSAVKDLPLWMVQTGEDTLASTQAAYDTLTSIGADVKWTHFETGANGYPNDHWSWVPTLNNFYSDIYETHIFDWLFSQENKNRNFEIVTEVFEYGQDVTSVIIDAGKAIDGSTINVDTFTISTTNHNPTNGNTVYSGEREITKAYVSDVKDTDGVGKESGRYIVLELKHGFTVQGSTALIYTGGANYVLDMQYKVAQNTNYAYSNGAAAAADSLSYTKAGEINLIVDDFEFVTYQDQFLRVYAPEAAEALPLVLWNHGIGETFRGTNESAQIRANMGGVAWVQDEYPCYVIAPQRGTGTNYSQANVIAYINELVAAGKVDPSRIYVAGCSAGGAETLNYMKNYSNYFAAAIPICPAGSFNDEEAARAKDIPMWFFHAQNDPSIPVNRTQATVAQLSALNPKELKYTELENLPYSEHGIDGFYNGHWSWIPPLNNCYSEEYQTNVFDWLFSNKLTPAQLGLDISLLEFMIGYADQAVAEGELDNVIPTVVNAFNAALENAKYILKNAVTQTEIDEAAEQLMNVIQYLEFKQADKSGLIALIALVEKYEADKDDYIPSTYAAYEEALADARSVVADEDLMDANAVTEAVNTLMSATAKLRLKPNKDKLNELLTIAAAVDTSVYTEESAAIFARAYDLAVLVDQNEESIEKDVKIAEEELQDGLDGLTQLGVTGNDPSDSPFTPSDTDNDASSASSLGKTDNPKTGDIVPIVVMTVLLAGCFTAVAFKKRKMK